MNAIQILTSFGIISILLGTHYYLKSIIEFFANHRDKDILFPLLLILNGILVIYICNS
jgi:hypothetical protein